jgi:hemerythrin-like domain-containing protein
MLDAPATELLLTEHRAILRMLDVTHELSHLLEVGADVPPDMLDAVADFLRAFGEEHHRKEEEFLFPALEKHGPGLSQMALDTLIHEHDRSRALLGKMTDAAAAYRQRRPKADRNWGRFACEYASVLRRHIDRERDILYPAAEQVLSPAELQELKEVLLRTEEGSVAQERRQRFSAMADALAAEVLPLR